jgi:hypothetical protein
MTPEEEANRKVEANIQRITENYGESDEPIRMVLMVVLFLAVLILGCMIYLPTVHTDSHPPEVDISRSTDDNSILITYLGGIDTGFVGNFNVTMDNKTAPYPNDGPGNFIAIIFHPNYTCVNVDAMDLAIQTYRPIGSRCL